MSGPDAAGGRRTKLDCRARGRNPAHVREAVGEDAAFEKGIELVLDKLR